MIFLYLPYITIFTAHKRSLRRLCFYMSVCPQGGGIPACLAGGIPACLAGLQGVYPSMLCRYPDPHPGGSLRGLAGGVSRPTPRVEVQGSGQEGSPGPHPGGGSQHALRQIPPPDGYCCGWYASYWNAFLFCYVAPSNNTWNSWLLMSQQEFFATYRDTMRIFLICRHLKNFISRCSEPNIVTRFPLSHAPLTISFTLSGYYQLKSWFQTALINLKCGKCARKIILPVYGSLMVSCLYHGRGYMKNSFQCENESVRKHC